jgi:hypothetical protein
MNLIVLADAVAAVHLAIMLFAVVGQLLIVAGWLAGWRWVRNFWFRLAHLMVILVVTAEGAIGLECPFKTWERSLRLAGGAESLHDLENATAVGRFCQWLLYYDLDIQVLLAVYVSFLVLVLLTAVFARPDWPWSSGAARRVPHSSISR